MVEGCRDGTVFGGRCGKDGGGRSSEGLSPKSEEKFVEGKVRVGKVELDCRQRFEVMSAEL